MAKPIKTIPVSEDTKRFLRKLQKQILVGIRPCDPILEEHPGMTPEQASAYMFRDVFYNSSGSRLGRQRYFG